MSSPRPSRAGESIEDFCRACKLDRMHTVVATDATGRPLRVVCGFCRSEHNYRGGPRTDVSVGGTVPGGRDAPWGPQPPPAAVREVRRTSAPTSRTALDLVTDRERIYPPMSVESATTDLELLLRRVIREEAGVTAAAPAEKWRGGHLVLRPGTPGIQEKSWPIETFFHKIVMLRNRLRTLEQHLNASELPDDLKVKLQGYITGCYGSLTSFNVLFADEDDQFKGTGGE
jgi:hypothetical protein